jgi:hypothetical protein
LSGCTLTIGAAGCTLTDGAAGCTLTVGAAGCTQTIGATGCTRTVGAAGRGLVGAGGVLGLRPCGSRYALAAQASPTWFVLCANGSGFALTTIK